MAFFDHVQPRFKRILSFYPKARQPRPGTAASRKALMVIVINLALLQVLFLCLFSYVFGSLYQQDTHIHNLNVAWVDYDGGIIGDAVRQAYGRLRGDNFPTLVEQSPGSDGFAHPLALRSAVCNVDYWAALYTSPGASDRLATALAGGPAATSYNRSDVLTYVWNQALYPTVVDSGISNALQQLSATARVALARINGTGAMQILDFADPAAIEVFSQPWDLVSLNIQPTEQGARVIYNSLVVIFVIIQNFFFLANLNGLQQQYKIWSLTNTTRVVLVRLGLSVAYAFLGSLFVTTAIWAFRGSWDVNGNQFVLTWMAFWLFSHLSFLTLDVFAIWLPPPFVPMALITWIVISVSSILVPFELSPGFYRWAHAIPAHNLYMVLIDIWSGGCNPRLHYALPVLFAYELSSLTLSTIGVFRRSHYAAIAHENEERVFKERITEQCEKMNARETYTQPIGETGEEREEGNAEPEDEENASITTAVSFMGREDLADRIWRETSQLRQQQSRSSRRSNLGPSFDFIGE